QQPASTSASQSFPLVGSGAAVLAGFATLLGTLGLAVLLMPSLLPTSTARRVERYLIRSTTVTGRRGRTPGAASHSILTLLGSVGKRLTRLSPKSYTGEIENQITLMGPPYRMTVVAFLGIQLLLSVLAVGLILVWVAQGTTQTPAQWALAGIAGLGVGAYLPYFLLKRRSARRQKVLLRALPGALDFLAIN